MYLIIIILTLLSVCFLLFFKPLKRLIRMIYLARNFVGPKAWPLLGNAYLFLGVKPEDILEIADKIFSEYGKTVKFWLGPVLVIFAQDTNDIEYILGSNNLLMKSQDYDFLNDWLCEGLLISKPSKWFKRRRILTPAFHFTILEQFIESFEHNTRIFVKNLREAAEKSNGLIQMDRSLNWMSFFMSAIVYVHILYHKTNRIKLKTIICFFLYYKAFNSLMCFSFLIVYFLISLFILENFGYMILK